MTDNTPVNLMPVAFASCYVVGCLRSPKSLSIAKLPGLCLLAFESVHSRKATFRIYLHTLESDSSARSLYDSVIPL